MKRRNLAGAFIAAVAAVIALCPPAAADPGADPGDVQTLQPSLPSTPARDEAFLSALASAGIRVVDVPTAIFGGHDTCAFLAVDHHVALDGLDRGWTRRGLWIGVAGWRGAVGGHKGAG